MELRNTRWGENSSSKAKQKAKKSKTPFSQATFKNKLLRNGRQRSVDDSVIQSPSQLSRSRRISRFNPSLSLRKKPKPKSIYNPDTKLIDKVPINKAYYIIQQCILWIRQNGMLYPGIFRCPAAKSDIRFIKDSLLKRDSQEFFEGEYVTNSILLELLKEFSQPTTIVADVLKKTLRDMEPALLPNDSCKKFIQFQTSADKSDEALLALVEDLPKYNQMIFKGLLIFLKDLSEFESENKMGLSNLSMVFGPTMVDWSQLQASGLMLCGIATYLSPFLRKSDLFKSTDKMGEQIAYLKDQSTTGTTDFGMTSSAISTTENVSTITTESEKTPDKIDGIQGVGLQKPTDGENKQVIAKLKSADSEAKKNALSKFHTIEKFNLETPPMLSSLR